MERIAPGELPSPYVAADFSTAEFHGRIEKVREGMRRRGLDAMLLASPENIYYLLGLNHQGYFSFTLLVLPLHGAPLLVTREMERHTVSSQVPSSEHVTYGEDDDPAEAAAAAILRGTGGTDTVGLERAAMFLPVGIWERVRELVPGREWTDGSGIVEDVRAVKSPAEVALIRRAAGITDRAVRAGVRATRVGMTERSVAATIYRTMIRYGSEHPGFAPFIRSTDILHHEHVTWREHTVSPATGLLIEISACVYRYHAPMTRMVYTERLPAGVERAAQAALAGLTAIKTYLRPGMKSGEVYAAWYQAVYDRLGHVPDRHHCGYMIGIGFPPSWVGGGRVTGIRPNGTLEIEAGMVFHVQSWILGQPPAEYCISDTALVTPEGCELLTTYKRKPSIR